MMHAGRNLVQGFLIQFTVRQFVMVTPLLDLAQLMRPVLTEKDAQDILRPGFENPLAGIPSIDREFSLLEGGSGKSSVGRLIARAIFF